MTTVTVSLSIEARLAMLERRLVLWRRLAVCIAILLGLAGGLGFRRLAPGPLEASSLTFVGTRGNTVTLSLRPSGELEARFGQRAQSAMPLPVAAGLVLVSPRGRELVRLGEPSARQLAP